MNSVTNISLSGMKAAQARLQTSAHNIANMSTEGFHRQAEKGASLAQNVVQQLEAQNVFLANLAVFKRSNEALGSLLDSKA